mgnify:CR=1 FL=1
MAIKNNAIVQVNIISVNLRLVVLCLTDKCLGRIKKREINVGKLRVMIIFVGSFQEIIYGTIQYREALQQAS